MIETSAFDDMGTATGRRTQPPVVAGGARRLQSRKQKRGLIRWKERGLIRWMLVVVLTVVGAGAALGYSLVTQTPTWEANALVRVGRPEVFGATYTDPAYVDRVQQTVVKLAQQRSLLDDAWQKAGVPASDRGRVTASVDGGSELVSFFVQARYPEQASGALNAVLSAVDSQVHQTYNNEVAFQQVGQSQPSIVASRTAYKAVLGGLAGLLIGLGLLWAIRGRAGRNRSSTAK